MSNNTDMTMRELFEQANGIYPSYDALIDRLVEIWQANTERLPLFVGTSSLLKLGLERGWISADERSVMIGVAPVSGEKA